MIFFLSFIACRRRLCRSIHRQHRHQGQRAYAGPGGRYPDRQVHRCQCMPSGQCTSQHLPEESFPPGHKPRHTPADIGGCWRFHFSGAILAAYYTAYLFLFLFSFCFEDRIFISKDFSTK